MSRTLSCFVSGGVGIMIKMKIKIRIKRFWEGTWARRADAQPLACGVAILGAVI